MSFIIKLFIKISLLYARLVIPKSKELLITLECEINHHRWLDKFEDDTSNHGNKYFEMHIVDTNKLCEFFHDRTIRGCIKQARAYMKKRYKNYKFWTKSLKVLTKKLKKWKSK